MAWPPSPLCYCTGLWTWKHPSWDTAGEDHLDVTPKWAEVGGC